MPHSKTVQSHNQISPNYLRDLDVRGSKQKTMSDNQRDETEPPMSNFRLLLFQAQQRHKFEHAVLLRAEGERRVWNGE